jgi:hypothetical protein
VLESRSESCSQPERQPASGARSSNRRKRKCGGWAAGPRREGKATTELGRTVESRVEKMGIMVAVGTRPMDLRTESDKKMQARSIENVQNRLR